MTQAVVVSEYFNASYPSDEWIELLVINDNLDLRGFSMRDNNGSQTNWTNTNPITPITFNNIGFWNNLRAGTIIIIWLRNVNSTNVVHPIDLDKTDGFVMLNAMDINYFSTLIGNPSYTFASVWGSAPFTSTTSYGPTIANSGELVQIRNSSSTHIHALGHISGAGGSDFTNILSTIKLNHSQTIIGSESVRVDPGANLAGYGGGSGTTLTSKGATGITFGLPNSTSNLAYWRSIRQPLFPSNTLNAVTSNAAFTQFYLSWNACTDPYPADSTTGYLILRNITNSFSDPQDGTNYTAGQSIGSATVVASIVGSNRITFTDNTNLACGQTFFYKVYAYRFNADNQSNSSTARGRAYNETGTNVQSISRPQPTPISSILAY